MECEDKEFKRAEHFQKGKVKFWKVETFHKWKKIRIYWICQLENNICQSI